jgi:hypothetical protein
VRTRISPEARSHLAALKQHVRTELALDEQDSILITELNCTEPGCPPVETVIAVLPPGAEPRRWTVHHPLSELTPDLLTQALHENHDHPHDQGETP